MRDEQVVQRRRNGADGETELEPQRDVDEDAGQRQHRREHPCRRSCSPTTGPTISVPSTVKPPRLLFFSAADHRVGFLAEVAAGLRTGAAHPDHHAVASRRRRSPG